MKVTVIDEVPVIEVTVIKPTAGNHGTTMDATTGKTNHTTTHATHAATTHAPAASTDRHYSADISGAGHIY